LWLMVQWPSCLCQNQKLEDPTYIHPHIPPHNAAAYPPHPMAPHTHSAPTAPTPPHLMAPPQVPPPLRPTAPALHVQWPCHTSQITNVFNFYCTTIISVLALDLWTILMLWLMDIGCC
jgi:hypothetical protein